MQLDVMLFAAGFGTRMRPLTDSRPKPLIDVAGKPLLDHALDIVRAAPHRRIVVNSHYLGDQIAAHLHGQDVAISHEADQILDTGGGLKAALPLLGAPQVATLNTDAIWSGPNPLATALAAWQPDQMDALLLCLPAENAIGRKGPGDFTLDAEGRISRGGPFVYSGLQILKPGLVADHPGAVFSLNAVWDRLIASGRAYGTLFPGQWCDVGHPGGIAEAEALLRKPRDV
jgi:MurNAc alpha-1-phosphate uridylyltransferase